jgi:homocysteine S-methyltransferase
MLNPQPRVKPVTPAFLKEELQLLDGGLATQLEASGYELNHKLWSARLLLEKPEAIIDAHLAYLRAGAQCIISASYQASIDGFMQAGLSRPRAEDTIKLSVQLAQEAVELFCRESLPAKRPLVAASIGPYGACLADGSEYHGRYDLDEEALVEFHRSRVALLGASDADLLACETIPSLPEAAALGTLLSEQHTPAWLSFSCADEKHLNDGHPISTAAALLNDNKNIFALGVNCTSPQYINPLIKQLKASTDKVIVVYPNSGERFDAVDKTWHGTALPRDCAQAAVGWYESGAGIIGGCCRMGPEHIREIAKAISSIGK